MDGQAQAIVLENIRSQIANRWQQIVAELRSYGDQDLATFLDESGLELSDVLRRGQPLVDSAAPRRRPAHARRAPSWRQSCSSGSAPSPTSTTASRAGRTRACLRDDARRTPHLTLPSSGSPGCCSSRSGPTAAGSTSTTDGLAALRSEAATRDEIAAVVDLAFDAARHHDCSTSTDELGRRAAAGPRPLSARRDPRRARLSRGSRTASAKASVLARAQRRRLLRHAEEVRGRLLADHDVPRLPDQPDAVPLGVPVDDLGRLPDRPALPHGLEHACCSSPVQTEGRVRHLAVPLPRPGRHVSHDGDRPIAITWQLEHPMPTDFFTSATVAAG